MKTFEEIINSVSFDDLKTAHLQSRLPQMQEFLEYEKDDEEIKILEKGIKDAESYLKDKTEMQTGDTLKNIAYFARIISQIHPGWDNPDFEKEDFKRKVETLYDEQSRLPKEKRLKIAETLWGDKRPYCLSSQKRNTQEATLQEIGHFSITEQPRWQETEFKGHRKGLYILVDKETASGAEAIVPMLEDYPNVQFIGENTCGCCQYGAVRPIALPCGGWVNIGSIFRQYSDGMVECIGHEPDINCSGQDAYQVCLNLIQQKMQLQQQTVSLIDKYKNLKGR